MTGLGHTLDVMTEVSGLGAAREVKIACAPHPLASSIHVCFERKKVEGWGRMLSRSVPFMDETNFETWC